jgi:redox-sensing transcriptional repressor
VTRRPSRAPEVAARQVPEATVARLPVYLRVLASMVERGVVTVSSEALAKAARVSSAQLRKDLSRLGSYGTRGVGYDVQTLLHHISQAMGVAREIPVVIVGVGSLGHALANYGGLVSRGFRVVGLLDADPALVGEVLGGVPIRPAADLEAVLAEQPVCIAVVATPASAAQQVCDRLVRAGVTSILNFAPVQLDVPPGVDVRKVDLSLELQILAYHVLRRRELSGRAEPPALVMA